MENSFFELIQKAQYGGEEAFIEVISKFEPTIKKFSKELNYEEAKTDLIIGLIEILKSMKLNRFDEDNDGAIVNYIYNSIKNKKVDLYRAYVKKSKKDEELNLDIVADESNYKIEEKFYIEDLLKLLTNMQKIILEDKFIKGYSDIEIATKLKISRQAVNKAKNKGLKSLKKYLQIYI